MLIQLLPILLLASGSSTSAVINDSNSPETVVLETKWNGDQVTFLSKQVGDPKYPDVELSVVSPDGDRHSTPKRLALLTHEGGVPEIAAIGFANADKDRQKELIVIVRWSIMHYDVSGSMYDVQIYDDLHALPKPLNHLEKMSAHFGLGCECWRRNGADETFRYRTIAAIKKELKRLGF